MDLIERYVAIADRCDPPRTRGCTGRELRRLLMARIAERETSLGRPLSTDEAVAELVGFARRLLAESRAVIRRLEEACLGADVPGADICNGGSHGPR